MYWTLFRNLLGIENQKNLRRNLLWIEISLLVVFMSLIFVGLYVAIQGTPDGVTITETDMAKIPQLVSWPGALAFSLRFAAGSKLLLIIFVGSVTASEYTWRTYQLWLSRGVPRTLLLVSKFVSLSLPILSTVTATLIAGALITAIFSLKINGSLYLDQINFWRLGWDILRTGYSLLPYVSITFLLAVATRSAVAAIGGCAGYGLIVEGLLGETLLLMPGKIGAVAKYLPSNLMQSILSASWTPPALMEDVSPGLLGPNQAAIGIVIWTLGLFCLALWMFRRQDFSG
jgi:ABC-type transport system involved in multi-copper enzyme maturation permease subunit